MGLLDEAIREHLDLKRRRGADPVEIERAEREALGPVRRGPDPLEAEDLDAAGGPFDAHAEEDWDDAYDSSDEPEAADSFADERQSPSHGRTADLQEPTPGSASVPPAAGPPSRAREPEDMLLDDELFADPEAPPPHRAPPAGDETVEFRVEDALASERGGGEAAPGKDEDVLEETPEFLQDTPDHDRLWFEQRPPRDFDFDK